jgi:hypothetical protein
MKIRRNMIRRPSQRDIAINPPAGPREPNTPEIYSVSHECEIARPGVAVEFMAAACLLDLRL